MALVLDGVQLGSQATQILLEGGANPNAIASFIKRNGVEAEHISPLSTAFVFDSARWVVQ